MKIHPAISLVEADELPTSTLMRGVKMKELDLILTEYLMLIGREALFMELLVKDEENWQERHGILDSHNRARILLYARMRRRLQILESRRERKD